MKAFIEPQGDDVLLELGYTVEVHITPDGDTSDMLDIRDFLSFADALMWAQTMGYKVCAYQSE
jgi:hypothetical protein